MKRFERFLELSSQMMTFPSKWWVQHLYIVKIKCMVNPYLIVFFANPITIFQFICYFSTFKKGMFFFSCTSTCTNTFRVTKEVTNLFKSFVIRDLIKDLKYMKFCSVLSISCRNTVNIQCVAKELISFIISNISRLTPVSIKLYL